MLFCNVEIAKLQIKKHKACFVAGYLLVIDFIYWEMDILNRFFSVILHEKSIFVNKVRSFFKLLYPLNYD